MYVVQHPHTRSNNTDKYRVVDFNDWMNFQGILIKALSEHDNYADARDVRNKANEGCEGCV